MGTEYLPLMQVRGPKWTGLRGGPANPGQPNGGVQKARFQGKLAQAHSTTTCSFGCDKQDRAPSNPSPGS